MHDAAVDFLTRGLALDPKKRMNADEALNHPSATHHTTPHHALFSHVCGSDVSSVAVFVLGVVLGCRFVSEFRVAANERPTADHFDFDWEFSCDGHVRHTQFSVRDLVWRELLRYRPAARGRYEEWLRTQSQTGEVPVTVIADRFGVSKIERTATELIGPLSMPGDGKTRTATAAQTVSAVAASPAPASSSAAAARAVGPPNPSLNVSPPSSVPPPSSTPDATPANLMPTEAASPALWAAMGAPNDAPSGPNISQ
jgi:hypothetical protein